MEIARREQSSLPILIQYKDGTYQGDIRIMSILEKITSYSGIPNYDLYKLTLDEYKRNRWVYDLMHNSPYLLKCRILGISKLCWQLSELTNDNYEELVISIVPPLDRTKYPALPLEAYNAIKNVIGQLMPYIPKGDIEEIYLQQRIEKYILILYYSEWETNMKTPSGWFKQAISLLEKSNPGGEQETMFKNVLQRLVDKNLELIPNVMVGQRTLPKWWSRLYYRILDNYSKLIDKLS